jgi:hypothetical protein
VQPVQLVGLVLLGVGVWMVVRRLPDLWFAPASNSWPHVTGTIVTAAAREEGVAPNSYYELQLSYTYTVHRRRHVGHRLFFGPTPRSKFESSIAQLVEAYGENTPVMVYYDPLRPDRAVLRPGVRPRVWLRFGTGLVLAFVGLALSV